MTTLSKLLSFSSLPEGWHFGEGGPIDAARIIKGVEICSALEAKGYSATDAFPGIDGSLRLTGYWAKIYLEATIEVDNSIDVLIEDELGERPIYSGDNLSEAICAIPSALTTSWGAVLDAINAMRPFGSIEPVEAMPDVAGGAAGGEPEWSLSELFTLNITTPYGSPRDFRVWSSSLRKGSPSSTMLAELARRARPARTLRGSIPL